MPEVKKKLEIKGKADGKSKSLPFVLNEKSIHHLVFKYHNRSLKSVPNIISG